MFEYILTAIIVGLATLFILLYKYNPRFPKRLTKKETEELTEMYKKGELKDTIFEDLFNDNSI
jgi:multisubunit Na+/H+ antiporter MnhC subunit